MKAILLTIVICVLTIGTGYSLTKNNGKMNTIVLVHGAWLDASCWDKVIPHLKAAGHEVIAVNLPGHGKDNTTPATVNLQTYVDAVKNAIGSRKNVILVGHSMGGIVITQTAEQIPSQISRLVYLGAFIPQSGESLLQLSGEAENKESLLGKYIRPDEKTASGTIAKEGLIETFAADAPKAIADKMLAAHKADPMVPFVTPVAITDPNAGSIAKTFIYTIDDKAIAYDMQRKMAQKAHVTRTYAIPASHTPFFSMPGVVAAIVAKEAE